MSRAGEERKPKQLGLSTDRFDFLDDEVECSSVKGSNAAYLAGPVSPMAPRAVLSPMHLNQGRSHWKERGQAAMPTSQKDSENASSKGALGKRTGQTHTRKFDARRESVSLNKYFQQMASGQGITDLNDDGEDLLAAIDNVGVPALSGRPLAAVVEQPAEEEPAPEDAKDHVGSEESQAVAPEPAQSCLPASPGQAEPHAEPQEGAKTGHGSAAIDSNASQGEIGGLPEVEALAPAISPEEPVVQGDIGGEEGVTPVEGSSEGLDTATVPQEPEAVAAEQPAAAQAEEVLEAPDAQTEDEAEAEAMEDFLTAERCVAEAPVTPAAEGVVVAAKSPVACGEGPAPASEHVATEVASGDGVQASTLEDRLAAATGEEGERASLTEQTEVEVDRDTCQPASSGDPSPELHAEQVADFACPPSPKTAARIQSPPPQEEAPAAITAPERESLEADVYSGLQEAGTDEGSGSGAEAGAAEKEGNALESGSSEEDSSEEDSSEEESEGEDSSSEEETSSEDEQPVRPPYQAPRFPTRLLDDYAATITPVRNLTQQARVTQQLAQATQQSPEEVSPQEVSKCLEPSIAELEDSPNQASPVPLRQQRPSIDFDEQPAGTEAKPQLASVVHASGAQEPLSRSSDGPECPARPFSASENIRWELWGEEACPAPGKPRTAEDAVLAVHHAGEIVGSSSNLETTVPVQSEDKAQDGDEPGSEVEAGEADDVFNASGDEEPIFAYISMASGIVTPAKAAQTPATAAKASTAKKTRFQPASVPRQPFMSRLEDVPQTEGNEGGEEPAAEAVGPLDHVQLHSGAGAEVTRQGSNEVPEAGGETGEGEQAGEREAFAGERAAEASSEAPTEPQAEQEAKIEAEGPGAQGGEMVGVEAEDLGPRKGIEAEGAPASPFAAAGLEVEMSVPTQLECLERLDSELLADGPTDSPRNAAVIARPARSADRSHSKSSLSRFAPDASISRQASASSVGKPTTTPSGPKEEEDLQRGHPAELPPDAAEKEIQSEVAADPPAEPRPSPAIPEAEASPSVLQQSCQDAAAAEPSSSPLEADSRSAGAAEPSEAEVAAVAPASEAPAPADVGAQGAEPAAGDAQLRASIDPELATELAALSVPQQASSPPPAAEASVEPVHVREEAPSRAAQQPQQSRLRRPETTKLAPRNSSQPVAPAAGRSKASEASHIPRPSGKARPPRASAAGPSALPRLARQQPAAPPSRIPQRSQASEESRKAGRPPAAAPLPGRSAAQPSQPAARAAVGGNKAMAQSRLKSRISRPSPPGQEESSPPARLLQKRTAAIPQTPPSSVDRSTPEYERMLNAALADEMMAFQGRGNRVANSPAEASKKPQGQATRLTASERHLREWDGEPLA